MTAEQQVLWDDHRVWALKIAAKAARRSQLRPDEAEPLKTAALVGLIQAVQRFDPARGLAFKTMAGMRIFGAVVDCLREESWVPRGVYNKAEPRECWDRIRVTGLQKISLNSAPADSERTQLIDAIRLPMATPALEVKEEVEHLLGQLRLLDGFVIRMIYLSGETMKAVAEVLDLSESRVCQIHARAIANLKRANGVTSAAFGSGSRG